MTNHQGVLINDKAQMTNEEGMTKSEAQKPGSADDSFRNGDTEWVLREVPENFLRMIAGAVPKLKLEARELWMEARELHLIFSKIWRGRKNE
jgi:hypothetical protein